MLLVIFTLSLKCVSSRVQGMMVSPLASKILVLYILMSNFFFILIANILNSDGYNREKQKPSAVCNRV